MSERTLADLKQKQALPLKVKVALTRERIRQWVHEFGEDGAYISFSGGKDSTVLLDIVRNVCGYTDIPAVFVDVPTQYPELKQFVLTFDNVTILKPKISFAQVCDKYGFPMISKEVSGTVVESRKYLKKCLTKYENDATTVQTDSIIFRSAWGIADLLGIPRRQGAEKAEPYQDLLKGIIPNEIIDAEDAPVRLKMLCGKFPHKVKGVETGEYSQMYDRSRYKFYLDAPFEISDMCCKIMKKSPVHSYHRQTGRVPMTAQMAEESKLRQTVWMRNGCNGFNLKIPTSNPLSFWTEQDVLQYIVENDLKICSVYGDVVVDYGDELEGQMTLGDFGLYDETKKYKCTGCQRTGCVLCGFGAHCEKKNESRFIKLKETHPKFYALLDVFKNNGITYREAIEWTNEHMKGRGHIYL